MRYKSRLTDAFWIDKLLEAIVYYSLSIQNASVGCDFYIPNLLHFKEMLNKIEF